MNVVVMLAGGDGSFLKNGQKYPKLLTEIGDKTMIEIVIKGLKSLCTPENNVVFMIRKSDDDKHYLGDIIKLMRPESHVVVVEGETAGAALTSLLAIEYLNESKPLVLLNGDQLLDYDESDLVEFFVENGADAGTCVFKSIHPRWSYVRTNEEGLIIEAAEKRPISDQATAGFYYYKSTHEYIECAKKMILKGADVDGIYYICPVFNEMILEQRKIFAHPIDSKRYHSFMSPKQVLEFEKSMLYHV